MHKMLLSEDDLVYPPFNFFCRGSFHFSMKSEDTRVLGKATSFRHRNCVSFSLTTGIALTIQKSMNFFVGREGTLQCIPPFVVTAKYISCDI